MHVLIFDTETTGLPEPDATIFQHNKWPHIIQLSYISYNTEIILLNIIIIILK